MFVCDGSCIVGYQGDTGGVAFEVTLNGEAPQESDLALFTVARRNGSVVLQKVIAPQEGRYRVPFVHEDTCSLKPDEYEWELRIACEAVVDGEGKITGMNELHTVYAGKRLIVKEVNGKI